MSPQFCLLHIAESPPSAPQSHAIRMQMAPSVCSSLGLPCSATCAASLPSAHLLVLATLTMLPVLLPSVSSFVSLSWLLIYRLRNRQLTFPRRLLQKESLGNLFHLIQFSLISMTLVHSQSQLMTLSSPELQVILISAFL